MHIYTYILYMYIYTYIYIYIYISVQSKINDPELRRDFDEMKLAPWR